MAIYTKTGDTGETGLYGGKRISKAHARISANGDLDELTSTIGWVKVVVRRRPHHVILHQAQRDIYSMMAVVAGYDKEDVNIFSKRTQEFERAIDEITRTLPQLRAFLIPGVDEVSSRLHVARAVCRRAERSCVLLLTQQKSASDKKNIRTVVQYLNRLSDLLFTLARAATRNKEVRTK